MEMAAAVAQAYREFEAARMYPPGINTCEIVSILEQDVTHVVQTLANQLFFSMAEVAARRPETIDLIACQYAAIGIWLGIRARELMEADRPN